MDTPALDLLGLPDDLLSGAVSRFCSAIALVNLAATCVRLRLLCKQAAEVLLEEAGAAATALAARIAGAATLRNLALLCGRAPLVTERFHEHVQNMVGRIRRREGTGGPPSNSALRRTTFQHRVPIDWAALQLLFVAFGDVTGGVYGWESTIDATLARALECMYHRTGCLRACSALYSSSAEHCIRDTCLRASYVLQALGICDRSSASRLIDWRSELEDVSDEDAADDDASPSVDPDDSEEDKLISEPLEFQDDIGVVIEHQWYGCKEDFFDLPRNFPEEFDEDKGGAGVCEGEGCCHNAFCWVEHGCMCMPAGQVFDCARRLHTRKAEAAEITQRPAGRTAPTRTCVDQDSVDLAAHFVSSKLWRRIRTPCPAAVREVEWLARHAAWRREGQADAAATLATLGKRVVEGVPFGDAGRWTTTFMKSKERRLETLHRQLS